MLPVYYAEYIRNQFALFCVIVSQTVWCFLHLLPTYLIRLRQITPDTTKSRRNVAGVYGVRGKDLSMKWLQVWVQESNFSGNLECEIF